jgi:nitrogen fixation protein
LATGLVYPANVMGAYTVPISVPPIAAGGTFSLRILPYSPTAGNTGTPTWAGHRNVQIIGTNTPVGSAHVRLHITKSTGSNVVPGNYPFNVTCTGPGGPYTGTNPVIVPLPGSGIDVQVPQNDTCNLTETSVAGWGQPIWGGSNAPIVPNGWSAQIGPMPVNTTLIVTNQPPVNVPHVRLHITKSTGSTVMPGNYTFNVTCTGPNGPYTGPNPVTVPLPGSGIDVQVPQGDTCNLTETPVAGWGQPIWGGSTAAIVPNGWSAQIGPMPVNTPLIVTNQPPATANFTIQKQFQGPVVPGVYTFHISCTNGYTGPGTIQITVPPNPASAQIQIPVNATCTISENPVGGWNPPIWGGSSQPLNPSGWSVTMGPFHPTGGPGDRVQVTNQP